MGLVDEMIEWKIYIHLLDLSGTAGQLGEMWLKVAYMHAFLFSRLKLENQSHAVVCTARAVELQQ